MFHGPEAQELASSEGHRREGGRHGWLDRPRPRAGRLSGRLPEARRSEGREDARREHLGRGARLRCPPTDPRARRWPALLVTGREDPRLHPEGRRRQAAPGLHAPPRRRRTDSARGARFGTRGPALHTRWSARQFPRSDSRRQAHQGPQGEGRRRPDLRPGREAEAPLDRHAPLREAEGLLARRPHSLGVRLAAWWPVCSGHLH